MEGLVRAVAHASGWWILGLLVAVLVQGVVIFRLSTRLGAHNRRWRAIARDAKGLDLETILADHARERAELTALYEGGQGRLARVEDAVAARKGRVGLVRFDAFPDVAGEHSFALALLDDMGDGVIVSSIVGREGGRVYGKGMLDGRSDRALTDEERRAIEAAGNPPRRK